MNDRGRVPFALIGVLLVLTSTTLAVSTMTQTPTESPEIDDAIEGAIAASTTELRGAADDAATEASIAPVTDPDETIAGRALNESQPFRDALRLRIYLRALERLDGVETTRGAVTVTASLPPVEATTEGYRNAIERVDVERVGEDGAALAVEIDGVKLSATRDGRTVTAVERTPSFVVSNPALLLHDRTEQFENRVNAPLTQSGLGQRLTTRLYPIAWDRGYAQYGGAPISTVLGTRHVELATNDALLAEQRETFQRADPAGHRGVAAAGRRVATTDALVGVGGKKEWQDAVLETADGIGADPPSEQPVGTCRKEPHDPEVTVGVNASADHAFADAVGVSGRDHLGDAIEDVHTVEARLQTTSNFRKQSRSGGGSPGPEWSHTSTRTRERVDTEKVSGGGLYAEGWKQTDGATFDVTITKTTIRSWRFENETTTTKTVRDRTYRVRVAAQARTVPMDGVSDGRLDGYLRKATDRATDRAISGANGLDGAARKAARGEQVRSTATATASPALDRTVVESRLGVLRDRTRRVSVTLPAPAVGTGRANPPKRLHEALDDRRNDFLIDADRTARTRTISAAQVVYLEALDSELETRRSAFDGASGGLDDALGEYLGTDRLDGALAAHRAPSSKSESTVDPAGDLSLAVDTAPSYLTTGEVTRDRIDERGGGTVYPLSTRSVNVFSSPHGQVAGGIFDRIPFLSTERVSLSTAARTLDAVDAESKHYDELEREIDAATAHVRGELIAELVDAGVPEHEAADSLRRDVSVADEALMLTNGTAIRLAVDSIDAPSSDERIELRLRTRLDSELEESAARPTEPTTTAAQKEAKETYGAELEGILADGVESAEERARTRALGERLGALPAGLPLAPIPGYWYATANVWHVQVHGQYERFAVRTNRGDGTGATTYLRDSRTVSLDHDGETQRLGSSEEVSFRAQTAVVVVVPPGPRGVGDTDGEPKKQSPGWDS